MALAIHMLGGGRRWFTWVASAAVTGFRKVATLLRGREARRSPVKSKAAEKQRRKELRRKLGV